jgi:uncharacterized membrane protein
MARDVTETVRDALGNAVREAIKNAGDAAPTKNKSGPLNGAKGIAAGMGLAAAAPFMAKKGVDAMRNGNPIGGGPTKLATKAASNVGDKVSDTLKETVSTKVDQAGGAGGLVKEAASGLLPFGGGGDSGGSKGGVPGVGKGRRMPVQQSVDVAVPIETAYNQWTQFEDWPTFMHRVTNVTQEDDCTVSFSTKIWTRKREFTAKIETQRPDERIKWRVSQGITHTGVVTFHELAPRLTRIELSLDVDPGSLIEKAARGMRHVKRAARADLHRYKAFIEMAEQETGAWRGVIEDGELVEEHDSSYDEEREYSDIDDFVQEDESEDEDSDEDSDEESDEASAEASDEESDEGGNGGGRGRTQRFKRQAERTRGGRAQAASGGSSSSRSTGRSSGSSDKGSGSSSRGSSSRRSSSGSGSSSRGKSSPRSKKASSSSSRSRKTSSRS